MMKTLESERLLLKPLSLNHCTEEYVSWLNDKEVYQFLETGGDYSLGQLKEYLQTVVTKKDILFWAVHLKETDEHIGNIKIDPINKKHGLGEYGIMMGSKKHWGKGYAKEASLTILNYCFTQVGIRKITLGVVDKNATAIELYKKIGFQVEGIYKKHGIYNGEYCDVFRMALFDPSFT